jgi:D-3-phosphoglycerate dehydrogenase
VTDTDLTAKARVWIYNQFSPDALTVLEPLATVLVGPYAQNEEWYEKVSTCDALLLGAQWLTAEVMDKIGTKVKVLARTGIGVDRIDLDAATERGILVTNTPDGPTESTAEHAVALMLNLAKGVAVSDRILHSGQGWSPYGSLPQGLELRGATLGLVGLGRIGGRVAEIARVLGMRVLAYDPFVTQTRAEALGVQLVSSLAEALAPADVVSIHCPAIPETYHVINAQTLAQMKPGSFLINVSRGSLIDEAALVEALQSGHLAGAGLDVFDPEPPKADNPLLTLPNTICTSHIGSYTTAGVTRMQVMACQEVAAALRGERPPNLINPTVWGRQRR